VCVMTFSAFLPALRQSRVKRSHQNSPIEGRRYCELTGIDPYQTATLMNHTMSEAPH
jgi:hypothetical protein